MWGLATVSDTSGAILALGRALRVTGDSEGQRVRLTRLEMEQLLHYAAEAVPVLWESEALIEFAACLLARRGMPGGAEDVATLLDEAAGAVRSQRPGGALSR